MSDATDFYDGEPVVIALVGLVRALMARMATLEIRIEAVEGLVEPEEAPALPALAPSIGERLRRYRRRNGFTQFEAGDCLNVDQSTVAKWELGHKMAFSHLRAIADWTGEPFDELVEQYFEQWG